MNGGFKTTADDAKIYDIDECLSPVSGKVDPWVRTCPQNRGRPTATTTRRSEEPQAGRISHSANFVEFVMLPPEPDS